MRHGRKRGRLGLVQEHRRSLLRNLARNLIQSQQIVTTHARAKEAGRFVDRLVTIAKQNTLHARRHLIAKLGSGSEDLAKRMIQMIAPKFSSRSGGYTRIVRYKERAGDGASLSILEFTIPVVETEEKKPKKKKGPKPQAPKEIKEVKEKKKKEELEKPKRPAKEEPKKAEKKAEEEIKKEAPKKGGFLSALRRFIKGDDEESKK
jgi:large subunit ribosomal protein L17